MKRSTLLLAVLLLLAFVRCTKDETIEEQVYIQETIDEDIAFSGEEGDQDIDKKRKD